MRHGKLLLVGSALEKTLCVDCTHKKQALWLPKVLSWHRNSLGCLTLFDFACTFR